MPKDKPATEQVKLGFGLPSDLETETANYQSEQISFPPYWKPEVGKIFLALVLSLDDRDPDFHRYVLQTMHPLPCERGDKHNKEDVIVDKDDFFTTSVYAGLPLDRYIGFKVLVKVTGTRDVGQPQDMFVFDLKLSPQDKNLLSEERRARAAKAIAAYRESRKLAAANGGAKPTDMTPPKEASKEVIKNRPTDAPF
jgi:hypothetical protein